MAKGHNIGIDINVEPWMHTYLTNILGPSPWQISKHHYEGKLLFANLSGKEKEFKKPKPWDKINPPLVYRIEIPWRFWHVNRKFTLSEEGIELFIQYYQNRFKKDLILWVESRITVKGIKRGRGTIYIKDAIEDFCKKYEIDEDLIPYETLKKRVYRYFHDKKTRVTIIES